MLTLLGPRKGRDCDGSSRRDFLRIGALGLAGLSLPDLLRARTSAAAAGMPVNNKSIIWLWLGGGASHIETFDPKLEAPEDYRSTVGGARTTLPGVQIGGVFPKIAKFVDKMALVRSFAHGNSGHVGGTHWLMTGYNHRAADNGESPIKPSLGSILSRVRGPNDPRTGIPTYVRLKSIYADGPAWLGAGYAPFDVGSSAKSNLDLKVATDRLADRRILLKSFDQLDRTIDGSGMMDGLDSFEGQALNLVLGRAKKVFDMSREDPRVKDAYGPDLGEQLLLARRLCEAGCGFVTIRRNGWDMHFDLVKSLKKNAPVLDQAVAAFVQDVHERGLDRKILLVITGEFGRTPRINRSAGRDHWAPLSTLALVGGGLKMGQVIGESSAKAEVPKSRPISPQDLMATLFHVLGIDPELQFQHPSGRPMYMIEGGRPIAELI